MADKIINTRLVLRNADLSAWEKSTVQLLKGEVALALLSGDQAGQYKVRIGTGDKTWNELSDQGLLIIPASNVEGLTEAIAALSTSYYETDDIAKLSDDYVNGDIAVEKKDIADGKQEYCAYRYDKSTSQWKALDGNYSAENVYFKDNIKLAGDYTNVGNIKLTDNTLSAAGKSVKTLMENIFTKELAGSIKTNPSTSTPIFYGKPNGGTEVAAAKSYEYGTYLTGVRFAGAAFTKGEYTYGPDTQQTTCTWESQGVNIALIDGAASNAGTCESICLGDKGKDIDNATLSGYTTGTTFSVKTKGITVADTVEAKTNLGNTNTAAGYAKVQFSANYNMSFKESAKFTGFRNMFFGSKVSAISKTSDNVRGLTATAAGTKTDYQVAIVEGANQVLLVVPSTLKVTKVLDVNAFGTDVFSSFTESSLDVEGANHYTAISYRVYEMIPEASLGANTYKVTITNA